MAGKAQAAGRQSCRTLEQENAFARVPPKILGACKGRPWCRPEVAGTVPTGSGLGMKTGRRPSTSRSQNALGSTCGRSGDKTPSTSKSTRHACHSTARASSAADADTPYKLLLPWAEMIPLSFEGGNRLATHGGADATMATVTVAGKPIHDAMGADACAAHNRLWRGRRTATRTRWRMSFSGEGRRETVLKGPRRCRGGTLSDNRQKRQRW